MSTPADDPRSQFEKAISEGAYTRAMLYAECMEGSYEVDDSWYLSLWLGVVYMHMGQPRRALPLLEQAVK